MRKSSQSPSAASTTSWRQFRFARRRWNRGKGLEDRGKKTKISFSSSLLISFSRCSFRSSNLLPLPPSRLWSALPRMGPCSGTRDEGRVCSFWCSSRRWTANGGRLLKKWSPYFCPNSLRPRSRTGRRRRLASRSDTGKGEAFTGGGTFFPPRPLFSLHFLL